MARVKKQKRYPSCYDSKFEYDLHRTVLKKFRLHPAKVNYYVEKQYTPDFELKSKNLLIEVKGRFRDSAEASKYVWVRKAMLENNDDRELVFIFQDPNKPMPRARARKDGTKFSHGEWAEKNNFKYFSPIQFEEYLND